ncbi:MAG: type II toxin-antitoxin system RelE/ParE family toxin [Planctomycetes bacterium]|nr:type II toxin-antitoxin system RelE/ParE family toxin [Planctomycetota bacterium]
MTQVHVQPLARRDIDDAVDYLVSEADTEVAWRFVDAFTTALERLSEYPEIGSPVALSPRMSGVRSWPLVGFESYSLFYHYEMDEVRVLRVLHAARDAANILLVEPLDP